MKKRIAIVGSRDYHDRSAIAKALDDVITFHGITEVVVVSGDAPGVDSIGRAIAKTRGYEYVGYPADWKRYGRAAGMIRNKLIIEDSDIVIAFWQNRSRGTADSIRKARKANKELHIHEV